jgi:2-dehydropantoate 2-reductase
VLGPDHVLAGICYVFSNIVTPGVIAHHQFGRIVFGELNGSASERALAFVRACEQASIPVELSNNIVQALWEKFVVLAPLAGTTSLTRLPVKSIRDLPATRQLWQAQTEELLALAPACGVDLGVDRMAKCVQFLESLGPENYSSMSLDLNAGKPMELDALIAYPVRLGQRHGIATPTLAAVYGGLLPYLHGKPGA